MSYTRYLEAVLNPAIGDDLRKLGQIGIAIHYESLLQATSRAFYWLYFVRQEKRFPNIYALNAYPGQLQIGPEHEQIKAFLARVEPMLDGKVPTEILTALLSIAAPPASPPTMDMRNMNGAEAAFFAELYEFVQSIPADAEISTALINWLSADIPADRKPADIQVEFLNVQGNLLHLNAKDNSLLLGNGLYPNRVYNFFGRLAGGVRDDVTYKHHYINALNEGGGDFSQYISNNLGKPVHSIDPKTTAFNQLAISILPYNINVKEEWNMYFSPPNPMQFYIPLLHTCYIQETTPKSPTDFIVKPVKQIDRRQQKRQFLSGTGEVCLQRPQFTLLITEPGRVRNLSGIIAWTISRTPGIADAWCANYSAVCESMRGYDDAEQLYVYELQSALFEMQPDLMRDDWWTTSISGWVKSASAAALNTAQLRALALVAARFNLFKATGVQQKIAQVLGLIPPTSILCDFQFVATPPVADARGNTLLADPPPDIVRREPLDNLNIAASELLRAQDYARRVYTATELGVANLYEFNVPFYVFPHISEIPSDIPDNVPLPRAAQLPELTATAGDLDDAAYVQDAAARNLRAERNPNWDMFKTWFSGNFWRLAISTDATANYRCVVFSHPQFLAQAFNRSSVAPGEVIPFSLRLKKEGARASWSWGSADPTAAAPARSRLGPNLAAVAARAEVDPNVAYAEFAALVPKYAVDLVDAKNTVAAITPRRRGFFGQSRNSYRRNLQGKLAKIRSTLRLNAVPRAAAVAGAEPVAPTRAQLLGNEFRRILDTNKSANTMLKQVDALQQSYANVWPAVAANVAAARTTPRTKRGFFGGLFGKNTAYEAGVRTTLRAAQQKLQRGGRRRTRKSRR